MAEGEIPDGEIQGGDIEGCDPLTREMLAIGARARSGAEALRRSTAAVRTAAIQAMASQLRAVQTAMLEANAEDLRRAEASGLAAPMLDRLALDADRVDRIVEAVETIAAIPDPVGAEMARWTRPNGLEISRVRTPIGVIAVIYEARPNVTADAAALCLRSGNAVILRGGSESFRSNQAIHRAMLAGLDEAGLTRDCLQFVPTSDRAAVGLLLTGLDHTVDLVIPRGGKSLVKRVREDARVAVLGHLEGLCHTYVHAAADPDQARAIVLNAKMRRVSVCGATETLLLDRAIAADLLPGIAADLRAAGCSLRGDAAARSLAPYMDEAVEADWHTEYLAPILAVRVVDGMDAAIAHILTYGSGHTECIVTRDAAAAERFVAEVDSAIVLINASTQFADGGEFGFGAEIGIATDKLHARGPVGAEQLTSFKYVVRGVGQIRP